MIIRLIEKGTLLNIVVLADNSDPSIKLNGLLHETKNDTCLLLTGDELYEYSMKQLYHGIRLSLTFFRGSKVYSFQGKIERTLLEHDAKLTEITAISGIEVKNRRSVPRFSLTVDVKLYVQKENNSVELICNGQTNDISCDAICFLSKENINVPDSSKFYTEFTLYGRDSFTLPAILVRNGNAPRSVRDKYDYVFAFDFSENQEERSRLVESFFINSLKAYNS